MDLLEIFDTDFMMPVPLNDTLTISLSFCSMKMITDLWTSAHIANKYIFFKARKKKKKDQAA